MAARLIASAELNVGIDYRLVEFSDSSVDETPPSPRKAGHPWLSAGQSAVCLESEQDIYLARFSFESWNDQPPPLDELAWPLREAVELVLPSGSISVHTVAGGSYPEVLVVGAPGRYQVRLGWRPGDIDPGVASPQAFALAQFWPA